MITYAHLASSCCTALVTLANKLYAQDQCKNDARKLQSGHHSVCDYNLQTADFCATVECNKKSTLATLLVVIANLATMFVQCCIQLLVHANLLHCRAGISSQQLHSVAHITAYASLI
jgi:hypothetical protein